MRRRRVVVSVVIALWLGTFSGLLAIAPSPYTGSIEKLLIGLILLPIPIIGAAALISEQLE
jgi:hypothetical protein